MKGEDPKEGDMKPYAAAWRDESSKGQTNVVYRLQVDRITKKYKKAAQHAVSGWNESGAGWNRINKTELWLLNRTFNTAYAFKKWAKEFPFELEIERDARGRKKKQ
jgi:hypothetical protein